jgi:hypothetical protein
MNRTASSRWIEAAKILIEDPHAVVRCPDKDDGVLKVRDEVVRGDPTLMERYMVCDTCGARNVIRMAVRDQ